MNIRVTKTTHPMELTPSDKLGFGIHYTDHMFIMDYSDEKGWYDPRIIPFQNISLSPAACVFHYGAEVFEGLKAYRRPDGGVQLFRPWDNMERLKNSCVRMGLPVVPPEDALEAVKALVKVDERFVPSEPGTSLYIRPFLFGTDAKLGLHGVHEAMFIVVLSPVGSYFDNGMEPVKIIVETEDVRAVRGGTGEAKCGGKRAKAAPRNKIWVAILALLTVLLLWSALRAEAVPAGQGIVPQAAYLNTSGPLYHYTDPTGDVIAQTGVDVSSYQGDIDWNAVREAGAEFAIVRVGFRGYGTGAIVEDSRFLQNVQGAKAAGLEVGVYFYSQALTEAEAEEEALFTLERVQALGLTGPVAYDLEFYTADEARTDALTGQQATLNAAAFCQVLETAGLRSVVYMNGHWSGAMYDLDALADWPIWYAGYGQPPTLERGVLLWQYTEEGTLPGITGPVDMDLWFEKSDT